MIDQEDIGEKARDLLLRIGNLRQFDELEDDYAQALCSVAALTTAIDSLDHVGVDSVLPEGNRPGSITIYALHADYLVVSNGPGAALLSWRDIENVSVVVTDVKWDDPRPSRIEMRFAGRDEPVRLTRRAFSPPEIAWALDRARRALLEKK